MERRSEIGNYGMLPVEQWGPPEAEPDPAIIRATQSEVQAEVRSDESLEPASEQHPGGMDEVSAH
jgi:hypothetical protein